MLQILSGLLLLTFENRIVTDARSKFNAKCRSLIEKNNWELALQDLSYYRIWQKYDQVFRLTSKWIVCLSINLGFLLDLLNSKQVCGYGSIRPLQKIIDCLVGKQKQVVHQGSCTPLIGIQRKYCFHDQIIFLCLHFQKIKFGVIHMYHNSFSWKLGCCSQIVTDSNFKSFHRMVLKFFLDAWLLQTMKIFKL